jgi:hypothetical protein
MQPRSRLALAVFVPFTAFSFWVIAQSGVTGLFHVLRAPWGLQVFLDLVIAMTVASTVVARDARARGLKAWPWFLAMAALGSIGLLGYFVYRDLAAPRAVNAGAAP